MAEGGKRMSNKSNGGNVHNNGQIQGESIKTAKESTNETTLPNRELFNELKESIEEMKNRMIDAKIRQKRLVIMMIDNVIHRVGGNERWFCKVEAARIRLEVEIVLKEIDIEIEWRRYEGEGEQVVALLTNNEPQIIEVEFGVDPTEIGLLALMRVIDKVKSQIIKEISKEN